MNITILLINMHDIHNYHINIYKYRKYYSSNIIENIKYYCLSKYFT